MKEEPSFGKAVDKALDAFYDKMQEQGWRLTGSGWGTIRFTNNTKHGRRSPHGGNIKGWTFQLKEIFWGPKGASM